MNLKLLILLLVISVVKISNAQSIADCSNVYTFDQTTVTDGSGNDIDIIIVEYENVGDRNDIGGWEFKTAMVNDQSFTSTYSGDGYLYYNGANNFQDGGNSTISYRINIQNPGVYRFVHAVGIGYIDPDPAAPDPSTEHNDVWVRFPDADAFYGYRQTDNTITIPNNVGINSSNPDPMDPILDAAYPGVTYKVPEGSVAGNNGFFKAYTNVISAWRYNASTSDNDPHEIFVRFDNAGTYTMELSARSFAFVVDRAVLYKEEGDFSNLNSTQRVNTFNAITSASPYCVNTPLSLVGQKKTATEVELTWIDNATNETGYEVEVSTQSDFSTIMTAVTVATDISTAVVNNLLEGTQYYFRVRANFASSNSDYTNVVAVTTNIKPTISADITVDVIGNQFVTFPSEMFTNLFNDGDGENFSKVIINSLPSGIRDFEIRGKYLITSAGIEIPVQDLTDNTGNARFRYRADNEFTGTTSFTFSLSDGFDYAEIEKTVNINVLKPQIQISQNEVVLIDQGDFNFGQVPINVSYPKTFIIKNIGNADLELTNLPLQITNNNITHYEIIQQPSLATLTPGMTTELIVAFKPTATGLKNNAQIVIANNDFNINDIDFRIDLFGEGIIDDVAPVITSGASVSVNENTISTIYMATADEVVTFSLGGSKDEGLFTLTNNNLNFTTAPDFENPLDNDGNNEYLVDMIATDLAGNMTTLEVVIVVNDIINETAPVITSEASVSVLENTTGVIYTATADQEVTYSLGNSKDESLFTLTVDALSFNSAPDFENPLDGDGNNEYLIDVIATNVDGNQTLLEVAITVTNVDEVGPVITSEAIVSILENTTGVIYTATADQSATFSLGNSKDESRFTLAVDALSFNSAPDFENPQDLDGNNEYLIDLMATDANGNVTTLEVAITVTNVDEVGPAITSPGNVSVLENTSGVIYTATADETVTFSLGNSKDESRFTLAVDAVSFNSAPDFENPQDLDGNNEYLIDLMATDANGNVTTLEVAITVTNVDEVGPAITSPSSVSVLENTSGVIYTATADEAVTFSLGNSKDESRFTLAVDAVSFNSAPDFENPQDLDGNNEYLIDLMATDANGNVTTLEVAITITNVDELGPVFTSPGRVSVLENTSGVIYTATADLEATFSLGNSKDEGLFTLAVDALSFNGAPDFENPQDLDGNNEYLIDLMATDIDGNVTTLEVAIAVTDVDEIAPVITSVANISIPENTTGVIYTALADESVTFSLGSSKDEGLFTLDVDALSFNGTPDFESPQDSDANNVYILDIIATDAADNTATLELSISVADENDMILSVSSSDASKDKIVIYPNPASDVIQIRSNNVELTLLTDMSGKIISKTASTNMINVSNVKDGNYLLIIKTKEGQTVENVIIKH